MWAMGDQNSWKADRLTRVLKQEFQDRLCTEMTITTWRHIAIAISKKHLTCGGFKRDYDTEPTGLDSQATHTSWTAGTIYARGIQEAPGHVEGRRQEYRAISKEWHTFLGFRSSADRKRKALGEIDVNTHRPVKRSKQAQFEGPADGIGARETYSIMYER